MTGDSAIAAKVLELIAEHFGVTVEVLTPETNFEYQLQGDPLDRVELAIEIEEAFKIELPDDDQDEFLTVQQVIDITETRFAEAVKAKNKTAA